MTLIVAYKDGRWFFNILGRVYCKPENYGLGLDMSSRVFQWTDGLLYWRWYPKRTHCLDIASWLWGKYAMVFIPEGEPKTYRYKNHLYTLQHQWKWDYRPRRGKHNRSKHPWTVIKAVDGVSVEHLPQAYQQESEPLAAMERYVWFNGKIKGLEVDDPDKGTYLV